MKNHGYAGILQRGHKRVLRDKPQKLRSHAVNDVVHIGRTALLGKEGEAQAHFCKVNGCTQSEYHAALGEANRIHAERSRHEWVTDIGALKDL